MPFVGGPSIPYKFSITVRHWYCGKKFKVSYKDIRIVKKSGGKHSYVCKCKHCGLWKTILSIRIPTHIKYEIQFIKGREKIEYETQISGK